MNDSRMQIDEMNEIEASLQKADLLLPSDKPMRKVTALDQWMIDHEACAKPGFKRDIDSISRIVVRAHESGATEEQCDIIVDWLESVLPLYFNQNRKRIPAPYKVQVSLRRTELATALKKQIKRLAGIALLLCLFFAVGCQSTFPQSAGTPLPSELTIEQFRVVNEATVLAQMLSNGSSVELTLPPGCVITVAAVPDQEAPVTKKRVMTMRTRYGTRRNQRATLPVLQAGDSSQERAP